MLGLGFVASLAVVWVIHNYGKFQISVAIPKLRTLITRAVFGLSQYRAWSPLTVLAKSANDALFSVYSVYDIVSMPTTRAVVYSQYVPI